jgi:hypothetical protein
MPARAGSTSGGRKIMFKGKLGTALAILIGCGLAWVAWQVIDAVTGK